MSPIPGPGSRILVTGATGFVGRLLVGRLAQAGARITALARDPHAADFPSSVERLAADLTDLDASTAALTPFRWDAIIHLAGPVSRAFDRFAEGAAIAAAHVRIALHLLRAVPPGFDGRVLYTSSMTVYGLPATLPVKETAERRPIHLYGLGKSLADDVFLASPASLDAWILRLPGLFSPERKGGALYHFARAAVRGEPLRVTATEPIAWDILDVRDAVDGIIKALSSEAQRPGAVNLSYGEPVEIVAMARRIAALAGRGSEVIPPEGVTHPVFQLDITRAGELLGFPPASLDARLRELLASVEEQ